MKAVLTYHSIDASGSVISVDRGRFETHMDLLAARDVRVRPLGRLLQSTGEEGVAITFDDAFENFASDAWPVLLERGYPATLFVPTARVGGDNGWDPDDDSIPRLRLLDWTALEELARQGVEIGSHTRTHPRLTELSDDQLRDELVGSRKDIEGRLGRPPETLAYPYGDVDSRVVTAAVEAGYALAVTTELRALPSAGVRVLELPRIDAYYLAKPGVMESWGTPAFERYLGFRRAARRVRSSLRAVKLFA